MKRKLNCILLIDDDEPTNFLNKLVIEEANCVEKCIAHESAAEALEYLQSEVNGEHPRPDLILLDVNMPAMNGWEFMEAYERLGETQKSRVIIVMLTTSLNPDDEERARGFKEIDDFKNKPLSIESLRDIFQNYFPEYL